MVPGHQVQTKEQRQNSHHYDTKFLLAPSPCTNTALPLSEDNVAERAKPGPQPSSNNVRAEGDKCSNQTILRVSRDFTERDCDRYRPPLEVPNTQNVELEASTHSCTTRNVGMILKSAQSHSSTTTTKRKDDNQTSKNVKLVEEREKTIVNDLAEQRTTNQNNGRQDKSTGKEKPSSLRCLYTNASCIMNKRSELQLLIDDMNPDIIGITESWCGSSVLDSEVAIKGYNLFRKDKPTRTATGGGLLLYFHENLHVTECHDIENNDFESSLWCDVKLSNNEVLLVGLCYRSPNSTEVNNDKLLEQMKSLAGMQRSHILIFGDFNFKEINWIDGCEAANDMHPASKFYDTILDL